MATKELESKIAKLKEWEELKKEADAEIESLKDEIKAEMIARDTEEIEAGKFICRYTTVISNRFDTTAFKREHSEMYKMYTKASTTRRFSYSE